MAHKHPVYDTDKHFVIDATTKKISTECPKVVLPQHSKKSERFTFEIPKEVEGHDMSLCNVVEIHFQNIEAANKSNKSIGIYKVDDLKADGETVFGSWLIDGDATYYVGGLIFALHFACVAGDGTVEYSLPTLSYSAITIGETVWNSETIAKEYPDIIAEFEARISNLEQNGTGGTVSDEQIAQAVEDYLQENPIVPDSGQYGAGLTSTEKSLILSLFKNAAYTADMSATIAQLETLWSGGDVPDEPVVPDVPDVPDTPTGGDISATGDEDVTVTGATATGDSDGNVTIIGATATDDGNGNVTVS